MNGYFDRICSVNTRQPESWFVGSEGGKGLSEKTERDLCASRAAGLGTGQVRALVPEAGIQDNEGLPDNYVHQLSWNDNHLCFDGET